MTAGASDHLVIHRTDWVLYTGLGAINALLCAMIGMPLVVVAIASLALFGFPVVTLAMIRFIRLATVLLRYPLPVSLAIAAIIGLGAWRAHAELGWFGSSVWAWICATWLITLAYECRRVRSASIEVQP